MGNKLINKNLIIFLLCLYLILLYLYLDNLIWLKYYLYPDYSHKVYSTFHNTKFSIFNDNANVIYSLKQFYNIFPSFNYYKYRQSKFKFFEYKSELYIISYWYFNDKSLNFLDRENFNMNTSKNIIIYPHLPFNLSDGGTTVQYYLAYLLDKLGAKVRIHRQNGVSHLNPIYSNYYDDDFDLNNTAVIYCEGIRGNPLNAPFTVRWMLSELGKNVPYENVNTWGKNELVYYFNSEPKFNTYPDRMGNIYKLLTVIYINSKIKTNNYNERHGYCHTFRKSHMHKNITHIHPEDSFEVTVFHTQEDYVEIFNKYKYFVSYDPLTFLTIIAPLCGCISIVYPLEGVSKKEWLKRGALSEYFKEKNEYVLYGIAYGNTSEELEFAKNTIHLVEGQWNDIKNYENKLIYNFINDINNFNECSNTVQNNYF